MATYKIDHINLPNGDLAKIDINPDYVDTSLTTESTSTNVPTSAAVADLVSQAIGAADAMRFKGTVGTGGTVSDLPTTGVQVGDTYRVVTAGTYAGHKCEVGDLIIATATTPTWTVAQTNIEGKVTSTFTGTAATIQSSFTPAGTVTLDSVTPTGTVSQPTFTGTEGSVSVSVAGGNKDVTITSTASASGNYTPEGTVSQPTFSGTEGNVSVSGTAAGTISTGTGTANYTPGGTVSAPTISVATAGSTTTVNSITDVGTLPSWNAEVTSADQTGLTFSWNTGTLPTKGANTTVKTGDAAYSASAPTFTGTGVELKFTGSSFTSTGKFTPAGTVSQPTFTGTKVQLAGSVALGTLTSTGTFTPAGTVSQPTFAGDEIDLSGTFTGTAGTATASYTPAGNVSSTLE